MELFSELLEAVMILCFGISWPISIRKSLVSRTAKGKSVFFELFILLGYIIGITRKFVQYAISTEQSWLFYLGWVFYFINFIMITVDMILYFRNTKLDKERDLAK
jgi:hypothetical protein